MRCRQNSLSPSLESLRLYPILSRMITLHLPPASSDRETAAHTYAIGDTLITSTREITLLAHYAVQKEKLRPVEPPDEMKYLFADAGQRTTTHQVRGWLSSAWRDVTVWHSETIGYALKVGGVGRYAISADGADIWELEADAEASVQQREETLIGPVLILAMSLQGRWAFHSSAVTVDNEAILFLGESGAGKSTIARYLHERDRHHVFQIADDILLTSLLASSFDALPHYAQLKLPVEQWPSREISMRIPIRVAFVIDVERTRDRRINITALRGRQASMALVRHTVATRLFGPTLLDNHVAFCARAAESIPIGLLTYPLEYGMLSEVCDEILTNAAVPR